MEWVASLNARVSAPNWSAESWEGAEEECARLLRLVESGETAGMRGRGRGVEW